MVTGFSSHQTLRQHFTPVYWETVPAGFPTPVLESDPEVLDLNAYLIHNPAATFYMRAASHAMERAGVRSGDLLIVDRSIKARSGQIVVAVVDGEFMMRRLRKRQGFWVLVAESFQAESAIDLNKHKDWEVWGVVTAVVRAM